MDPEPENSHTDLSSVFSRTYMYTLYTNELHACATDVLNLPLIIVTLAKEKNANLSARMLHPSDWRC